MEKNHLDKQNIVFALDIGTRSILGAVGVVRDKKFHVIEESYVEHEERAMIDGQIHDVSLVANAVIKVKRDLEEKIGIELNKVSIAAAGRFLKTYTAKSELNVDNEKEIDKDTIRSLELTSVKKAEEEVSKKSGGKLYCVGYTVKNYYLNDYVIGNLLLQKGEKIAAEVIATFLPRYVIDSLYSVMKKVGLIVDSLTLEPIAAMEAAIPKKLRLLNLALIDVGAGTSDIAICSRDSITAFGMVSLAGDEVTEAIVQNFLVDFETAEKIKKQCSESDTVEYIDVLGLTNKIPSKDIKRVIEPVVKKISEEIGNKIIEINGEKSPNAIFLVGGGAHTPLLKEFLCEKLNMPLERAAIKDRDAVIDCSIENNKFGSEGVTVLGIGLISIRRLGNDFIDVMLNGSIISLFNSHKHIVMDVMLQAGINPKVLLGRNGRSIRFTLNNIKRMAFGTLATNALIKINGVKASVEENIKEGDKIEIEFAKNGEDAKPTLKDYIKKVYSTTFFINDIIENLTPLAFVNGDKKDVNYIIKEGDNVKILFPETLGHYREYYETLKDYKYYLNGEELKEDYIIRESDRIYKIRDEIEENKEENFQINKANEKEKTKKDSELNVVEKDIVETNDEIGIREVIEDNYIQSKDNSLKNKNLQSEALEEKEAALTKEYIENEKENREEKIETENFNIKETGIKVRVNNEEILLKGKDKYIFVDIFNHVEFDLSVAKGKLVLLLNGKSAGYYDDLKDGDSIEIKWE
ncbi:cell division protein FtsA [Clostridium botulinum]|uniref:Putative cell division protein FtsA n=1 Tax=Clostridium botulinum (strain Langeland / NCTC 10281 / Type F) TaxID=441772 RepID=A7GDB9_CLOBL|nr:cell division FtsA domain-containing protein [Clostridium botulinum]ABS40166.1 putative cell division protein FtsA [Clostridium botulinum F str. Langeland]ADF99228.1 putative cell division protein FtsA [Clostridium botulinum F str. 230613]KKM43213.1 cell division protein FtsA [Clostridium botulinum]MBY6791268.1 rod shape-determining protein [Clostridium botulinum]MBY6936499.1 rod shape-determining protein [Clostridium botulinum]